MDKLNTFFKTLGLKPGLIIEENSEDFRTVQKFANEHNMGEAELRKQLLNIFSNLFDGFYIYDWKKFIPVNKAIAEETEQEILEVIQCVLLKFDVAYDEFIIDFNLTWLEKDHQDSVFKDRERGIEFLFPTMAIRKPFMKEYSYDEEIIDLLINLVKEIVKDNGLYEEIYKKLPELLSH
ncbi:hypothetical protein MZM54_04115 [[Brevibacterium] frigoritolerans]|nr:hypothetical protein [Peribacillus frigoritolerans]